MNLLEMSFSGTVFILAVVIIRTAAIQFLPKKTFLVLWKMVLLRLLVPIAIPSVFSIYTLVNRGVTTPAFWETETDHIAAAVLQEHPAIVQEAEQFSTDNPSLSAWSVIWGLGMLVFAAFFIVSYLRCRIDFQTSFPVNNAYVKQWLKEHPLKRHISIRQSDRIFSPLTYGVFCPVILMPKNTDWENSNQLQYIFAHEYVHICHFDNFTKLAAALILCIHWFNPFVWVMYLLLNRDIELACDESVVKQFGVQSKSVYSRMLIRMEAQKSGLSSFYSSFSKNGMEERITAIMNTKRATPVTFLSACLIVLVTINLFATSAVAAADSSADDMPAVSVPQTKAENIAVNQKSSMSITHESADILYYEDGSPYLHDILTNNTDKTIKETQYCMLAYDKNGAPLKLYWNFLDSSAESSFAYIVQSKENILSNQTQEYRGGWSLYDGEHMKNFPIVGNGEVNQTAYALFCLKQVVFEDGTVWNNPNYETWFQTYAGKETGVDELRNYYPYEYKVAFDEN